MRNLCSVLCLLVDFLRDLCLFLWRLAPARWCRCLAESLLCEAAACLLSLGHEVHAYFSLHSCRVLVVSAPTKKLGIYVFNFASVMGTDSDKWTVLNNGNSTGLQNRGDILFPLPTAKCLWSVMGAILYQR